MKHKVRSEMVASRVNPGAGHFPAQRLCRKGPLPNTHYLQAVRTDKTTTP